MKTRITELFGIEHPIISGGMIWCSGSKLASAVSNVGGLGLIGSGSMSVEILQEHIDKCREAVNGKPYGVNVPLFSTRVEQIIDTVIENRVPVVFTSGGNPTLYTERLKQAGIIVVHVTASVKFALKSEQAGVDAIVCEGFEAGGHNGRDELTTMVLTPMVADAIRRIPIIAAGGIVDGRQWLAVQALGADAIQVGSLFALSKESSAHDEFKKLCVSLGENSTLLVLKQLSPARLIRNKFFDELQRAELSGSSKEQIAELLGKGRARQGMFEGDLDGGELEIGQGVAMINSIESVEDIMRNLISQYEEAKSRLLDSV